MNKELLFSFKSPSRDNLDVYGFRFGKPNKENRIVILSGLNGEEIGGVFVCSQLVKYLNQKTKENPFFVKSDILIIPAINHFALNMGSRFWPLDNTDINVMFPGFDKGETTQRIAYKLFEYCKDATYGILIEDRRDKAICIPYVKLLESGSEDIDGAKSFGLPFIHIKEFVPIDSGSLEYNWSVWGTKAYSIVFGNQNTIFKEDTQNILDGVIRFLASIDAIDMRSKGGFKSEVVTRDNIDVIKAQNAGIFKPSFKPGERVKKGQLLGVIFDSLEGEIKENIIARYDGILTCVYNYPLINEHSIAFRLVKL